MTGEDVIKLIRKYQDEPKTKMVGIATELGLTIKGVTPYPNIMCEYWDNVIKVDRHTRKEYQRGHVAMMLATVILYKDKIRCPMKVNPLFRSAHHKFMDLKRIQTLSTEILLPRHHLPTYSEVVYDPFKCARERGVSPWVLVFRLGIEDEYIHQLIRAGENNS